MFQLIFFIPYLSIVTNGVKPIDSVWAVGACQSFRSVDVLIMVAILNLHNIIEKPTNSWAVRCMNTAMHLKHIVSP